MSKKFWNSLIFAGLEQAFSLTLYCSLVGILFWKGSEIFGKSPNYFGPVAFLLLFSLSALICGLIVFYEPYKLFFANRKKEAIDLVVYTSGWLFAFFLLFLFLAVFIGKA